MGCWNHTCAITNLPIYVGEEVEVVLLQSNSVKHEGTSFCYPDAYHTPLPLTFSGEYNDYGAVENCKGVALDIIVDTLRDKLFEMELGENKYHDIPVKKEDFNINLLFEADHEGRLYIHNPLRTLYDMRDNVRIKHIVIRKEVYEGIIDGMVMDYWDRNISETVEKKYVDLVSQYNTFTQDIDNIIALDSSDIMSHMWRFEKVIGETLVADFLSYRGQGTYGMSHPLSVTEVLFDLRRSGDEKYMDVLDNAVRMAMLCSFMNVARKSWHVPSGVGSQDDRTSYQELCAKLTLSSAEIVKHRWDEE